MKTRIKVCRSKKLIIWTNWLYLYVWHYFTMHLIDLYSHVFPDSKLFCRTYNLVTLPHFWQLPIYVLLGLWFWKKSTAEYSKWIILYNSDANIFNAQYVILLIYNTFDVKYVTEIGYIFISFFTEITYELCVYIISWITTIAS